MSGDQRYKHLSALCWTSEHFFLKFSGHKNNIYKTYPAIDLPVYGETDEINFVLIED